MNWGWNLEEYIEFLLRIGKSKDADEFQTLKTCFSEAKIEKLIKEIEEKLEEKNEERE